MSKLELINLPHIKESGWYVIDVNKVRNPEEDKFVEFKVQIDATYRFCSRMDDDYRDELEDLDITVECMTNLEFNDQITLEAQLESHIRKCFNYK